MTIIYNPKQDGWRKKIDEYSITGDKLDQITQNVGQQAFRIGFSSTIRAPGSK